MNSEPSGSRLRYFPITLLPTVMGLAGLAIVFLKFQHFSHVEQPIGRWLLYGVTVWFAFVAAVYLAKLVRYPAEVKAEFLHPIRINFFAAISICLLLLAIGYLEIGQVAPARVLWWIGAPLHLFLLLVILHGWFHKHYKIQSFNPAWFIPVVGPLLVPIAGVAFADPEVSWFFFAIGIIYWIVLLAVFVNRIFFHDPLPQKLVPTLFILIAPPAVGFISYVKLTGVLDPFARILFYFGVFNALMLLTMIGQFRRIPYFVSWWGYTFPMCAFTISLFLMFKESQLPVFRTAALVMTVLTTLTILLVMVKTLIVAARGGICVPED
ncbi:SLAC1 anion channel family protein [bacterium]|nr:SLAC1 anion channel family protein [bacterium]